MYHIKQDQRAQKSAERIYEALTILMTQQAFDSIKVSQLVTQAEVGRATFYRNFDVIEDVLRWQCDETVGRLVAYVQTYRREVALASAATPLPLLKPVLRFFYLDSTIVEQVIAAERIDLLQQAFTAHLPRVAPQPTAVQRGFSADLLEYALILPASSAVATLVHWIRRGKREAPDELADGLAALANVIGGNPFVMRSRSRSDSQI